MNKFEEEGNEYLIICNALDEELRRLMRDLDDFKRVALIRNKYMEKRERSTSKIMGRI